MFCSEFVKSGGRRPDVEFLITYLKRFQLTFLKFQCFTGVLGSDIISSDKRELMLGLQKLLKRSSVQ